MEFYSSFLTGWPRDGAHFGVRTGKAIVRDIHRRAPSPPRSLACRLLLIFIVTVAEDAADPCSDAKSREHDELRHFRISDDGRLCSSCLLVTCCCVPCLPYVIQNQSVTRLAEPLVLFIIGYPV